MVTMQLWAAIKEKKKQDIDRLKDIKILKQSQSTIPTDSNKNRLVLASSSPLKEQASAWDTTKSFS